MPSFTLNKTITTTEPTIEVTVSRTRPLPPGRYTFQLVVVNEAGERSLPATLSIEIRQGLGGARGGSRRTRRRSDPNSEPGGG